MTQAQSRPRGDGWISMEDGEPELYQEVLLRKGSGADGSGMFTGDGWMIRSFVLPEPFELDRSGITHWMPVPDRRPTRSRTDRRTRNE